MNKPIDMPADALLASIAGRKIGRRGFLAFAAKGVALAFALPLAGRFAEAQAAETMQKVNAFIRVGTEGSVELAFGGCEMGQGTMTGLAQILAEELMVDWDQIIVRQALVEAGVSYSTGGSSGVARRYTSLRKAGAAARELLVAAAMSATGDQNRANYVADGARVVHNGTTTWDYSALAAAAAGAPAKAIFDSLYPVGSEPPLTNPADFRLIGQPLPRVDIPSKVDGSAKYGIDIWFPDMVFAAIKHCPTIGGTLTLPTNMPAKPSAALAVVACTASDTRGKVVAGTCNAVAVVATNTWLAFRLANSLSVKWTLPTATADVDSAGILALAQSQLATGTALLAEPAPPTTTPPTPPYPAGPYEASVNGDLGSAPEVDLTYTLPYVAHATMEVLNCTVRIAYSGATPVACEIWAPTQAAGTVATNAAKLTGLPTSAITVNTTFLGGGLGRKIEQDYIWQAIQVAMAVKKPVKLTWKREEDFGHDQYRPFALTRVRARLDAGRVKAWSYRTVSQAITGQRGRLAAGFVDSQAVEGAVHLPYDLGNALVEWVPLNVGIPVGYWRSVGCSINTFVVESTMDELARKGGNVDPFAFRARHMVNAPQRAVNVLQRADLMTLWRKSLPTGRAWGLAIGQAFGTWVCEVVEISQPAAGTIKVHRVDCVVDCGVAINPDSVEAQMQGGILHALNATLWGQQTFTAGKANLLNFNRNRVMRINEMPKVTVQIVESAEAPSGTGEPGVPPLAPALANAYARLTGKRVTSLPFFPASTMGGL